mgnify:CR=1 FL=1|tara:strand:+ start:166 stop:372 length:207 start_codon:yes stop_codon:yes gene_type:complete
MKDRHLIALVTFAIFSTEAYAHYVVAKNEGSETFKFYKPTLQTTFKNLVVVGAFSLLNGIIIEKIRKG